jgi:hypothetical protein
MLVINIFDIDPFDLEVPLELKRMIFPPKGKGFLVVAGLESCHAFEHPTFDCAKEEISIGVVINFTLP